MPPNFYAVSYGLTLSPAALDRVRGVLMDSGAQLLEEDHESAERFAVYSVGLRLETNGEGSPEGALAALRRNLAAAAHTGVDTAVVPVSLRGAGRKLIILDVDSTLIQQEVIELLAAHAGTEAQVAEVTAAAMRGELDFARSLHARVATLAGLPESVLAEVGAKVLLTDGAERLVRVAKAAGHVVAAVSGGFSQILAPLAASLNLDHALANELEIAGGVLTGRVLGDVVDRAAKARALRRWSAAEGIGLDRTVAIGDGANDLDMMAIAGLSVAFNAKPAVREAADAQINIPFLDVALHLAGI
ncbi:MAG TPA: phosphoserine phosphatase SerB [Micrococcaceae bacterium]